MHCGIEAPTNEKEEIEAVSSLPEYSCGSRGGSRDQDRVTMTTSSPAARVQQLAVTPGSISARCLKSSFEAAAAGNNITAITEMHSSIIHSATYDSVGRNFEYLDELWNASDHREGNHNFGMLFCRNKFAGIVASVYSWEPYFRPDETYQDKTNPTLEEWSQKNWTDLLMEIEHAREACTRNDSRVVQPAPTNRNNSDAIWKTNIEFQRDYHNLVQKITEVGETFAPLRRVLLNGDYTTSEKIDQADTIIDDWDQFCAATREIEKMRDTFLEKPTPDENEEMDYLMEIAERLRERDVDLRELQRMIKSLIMRWDKICFPGALDNWTGDDGHKNVRKRTRLCPNVAASLSAISAHGRPKKYTADPRFVPSDRDQHGARTKVRFTQEEDTAILTGLSLYSSEQNLWVKIKLNEPMVLRNRTPDQLKDRVRILKQNHLIVEHAQR